MKWWAQRDLNPRPSDYESPALTTELWAQPAWNQGIAADFKYREPTRLGKDTHSESRPLQTVGQLFRPSPHPGKLFRHSFKANL